MTSSTASPAPRAQRAFEHARATFEEQMNSEELQRLDKISTLDHLVTQAQTISKALETTSKSTLGSRASKLASSLVPFERILEGVCKLTPMGGDLLWGSVSFILEMAKDNNNVLEEVLEFFMGMADEISYLQVVEKMFEKSDMVVSAIEAVYVAIIEFWVKAMQYYRIKIRRDLKSRAKSWLASSSKMVNEFTKLEAKISKQKTKLHEVEATQHHADEKYNQAQLKAAQRSARRKEWIKWIDASHYEHDLSAAEEHRYDGTCQWLQDKQVYRDWTSNQTGLLVVYGTAGVGKTILSSWLVSEARSRPAPQHMTLYHYFKETDDSKNTPLAAARSLIDQVYDILSSANHEFATTIESELQPLSCKIHVDFGPLWKILSSLLSQYSEFQKSDITPTTTIILDAMDECKDSRALVQGLRKLVHATSSKVRVIVTARQSGEHVDEFRRPYPGQTVPAFLEIAQDDVKDDIAAFVKHTILQIERLDDPKHYRLRDRIITIFSDAKNHEGMFLWAYLMCKEVECQLQVSGIRKLLDHLPKGLDGMYASICRRISANDEASREFSRLVLQWIVASRRPMTFVELEEALNVTTANDSENHYFGEGGGLLWSRRDIVRSCGDLVRYTGLAEGDTIGIIHLSARQFLSTQVSELFGHGQIPRQVSDLIRPFLVDVQSAELMMGMTCVKYILSTSPYCDEYFSPPIHHGLLRTRKHGNFKRRYPLLEYATLYWTDYVLTTIQSPSHLGIDSTHQLLSTVSEFTRLAVSTMWLEELIRLTYLEFAQHTIRRFVTFEALVPADILDWSTFVLRTLLDFSQALSSNPQMIRLCISQAQSATSDSSNAINKDIPLSEPDVQRARAWIHYDPTSDNLFSATHMPPLLKCQAMKTGIRLRPQVASPEQTYKGFFTVRSAAVNPAGDFIAVTYSHSLGKHLGYLTTCWNITNPNGTSGVGDWATLVHSDYSTAQEMFFHNAVAFGKDSTIITPGGFFSLERKECVDRPKAIYDPDPILGITRTCFSGHGERVARINRNMLEVLDIHGTSMCRRDFMAHLTLEGFSHTGSKVVVRVGGEKPRLSCFLVNEAKEADMSWPFGDRSLTGIYRAVFTRDEGRFVATVDQVLIRNPARLAVWTFPKDNDGSHRAEMIYIFRGPSFVFNLVPDVSKESVENALIVEASGRVTKQPLDLESSPHGQLALQTCWVLGQRSHLELIVWSLHSSGVKFETWAIASPQPKLVSCTKERIRVTLSGSFQPSPDGHHVATSKAIVDASMAPSGLGVYELGLPGAMVASAFDMGGALFACLFTQKGSTKLYVFDMTRGPSPSLQACFTFEKEVYSVVFSKCDPSLLAVDDHIMRLDVSRLTVQTQFDENIIGFSECGLYCYDRKFTLYRLPGNLVPETPLPTEMIYPTTMKLDSIYIRSPHVFKTLKSNGIVYLRHKLIHENDDAYRSRVICVVRDAMPNQGTLVWPERDVENLRLVTVWNETPVLIDTGIRKGELMKKDEWF